MNVVPKDAPAVTVGQSPQQQAARAKAIAAFNSSANQAQQSPVSNPSQVSPEEYSAIKNSQSSEQKARLHSNEDHSQVSEPEAETKVQAAEEPLSAQYAILARKEKALRQRDQQFKAREEAVKAREEAIKTSQESPKAAAFDESKYITKDRLTQDPFSVLTELGLTYDQLTEMALKGPSQDEITRSNEIKALREELKVLKSETENTKKSVQDQQDQARTQALSQMRLEAKQLINKDPYFETIKETQSLGDVMDLIEQTFDQDGILLSVEDAAREVEDYLVEEAMKISKIKKIQQRLQPKPAAEASQKQAEQPKQSQLKTLTNSVSSTRQLSARERALLAFENKLNK